MGSIFGGLLPGGGLLDDLFDSVFDDLFGTVDKGHYDASGRFYPGDYEQRLQQANTWIRQAGVNNIVDRKKLDDLLRLPSGWQGAVTNYINQLKKFADNPVSKGISDLSNLAGSSPVPMFLIGGALLYFLFMKK